MTDPRPKTKLSTAARLLGKLIETNLFTGAEAARQLSITAAEIDQFLSGALPVPLDVQRTLATLLIERVPALAREGHRLRGQVDAAAAYESGETTRHSTNSRPTNLW